MARLGLLAVVLAGVAASVHGAALKTVPPPSQDFEEVVTTTAKKETPGAACTSFSKCEDCSKNFAVCVWIPSSEKCVESRNPESTSGVHKCGGPFSSELMRQPFDSEHDDFAEVDTDPNHVGIARLRHGEDMFATAQDMSEERADAEGGTDIEHAITHEEYEGFNEKDTRQAAAATTAPQAFLEDDKRARQHKAHVAVRRGKRVAHHQHAHAHHTLAHHAQAHHAQAHYAQAHHAQAHHAQTHHQAAHTQAHHNAAHHAQAHHAQGHHAQAHHVRHPHQGGRPGRL